MHFSNTGFYVRLFLRHFYVTYSYFYTSVAVFHFFHITIYNVILQWQLSKKKTSPKPHSIDSRQMLKYGSFKK